MISRKLAVVVPVLTTLVFGSWGGVLGPLLPQIARTFHLRVEIAGVLLMVNFAGALVSVLLGGILADRFGKKRVFLVVLGGFTVAVVAFAGAQSFAIIAAACLLGGALGVCLEGLCGAIIADCNPDGSHRNMNMLQIAFSAGAVAALVVTSRLDAADGAWRTVYQVLAVATSSVFLLALFMRVPPAPPAEPISLPIVRRVMADPLILLLAIAIACYVGSEMSLADWISWILEKTGSRADYAKLAPGLFWLGTGVGRFVSGQYCRRYSGLRVLWWLVVGGILS